MNEMAKILIGIGIILVVAGAVLLVFGKTFGMGKFPGDIIIKKENFTFYFPLGTSILLSIIASILVMILNRK